MSESNKVKDTIEAVQGVVEAVPIYQDLAQPAVQEIGKGLHTISKLVHVALAPVSATVWGFEQISNYIQNALEEKLKDVPPDNIIPPDTSVAGPALEALRFVGNKEELREMFSTLIATSMNSATEKIAHPSFVDIIKQINSDEAKILKSIKDDLSIPLVKIKMYDKGITGFAEPLVNFSLLPYINNCEHPDLGPSYIENLTRLGLLTKNYVQYRTGENAYYSTENHPTILSYKQLANTLNKEFEINRGIVQRTSYGKNFYDACIK